MTELLITSSVLILALLLMRKLFGKSLSRRVQYALWALVLVRLLVPVNLPAMDFSVLNAAKPVEKTVTQTITAQPIYVPVAQEPLEEHPAAAVDLAPEQADTFTGESVWVAQPEQQTAVRYKRLSSQTVLRWIWIAGSSLLGAFLLTVNLRFWLWLRKVRKPYEVEDCRLPVYFVETGLPSPCLFGLFRPAIYLTPAAVETEESLRHVLAHECTHARHLDHLWIFLRGVCLAIYWFDPLVWAASAAAKKDCELACDEGALAKLEEDDRIPYGETLVSLIPVKQTVNPMLATTAMSAGKKHLTDRISRIAQKPRQLVAAVVAVAVLTVSISACTFTGGDSGKVVICIDTISNNTLVIESFLRWLDDCNKYLGLSVSSEDVEIELLPDPYENPTERSVMLQRIRAEIMAGRGPDLFLCNSIRSSPTGQFSYMIENCLFPYPEKTRESGFFLPLDKYLPDLTLTQIDEMIPQVLAGGKNQAGEQVILPLMFTVPGVIYADEKGAELPKVDFEGTSWNDVLKGDDPLLAEQVNWVLNYCNSREGIMGGHDSCLFCLTPQAADFENEKLLFSEEELSAFIKDSFSAYQRAMKRDTVSSGSSVFLSPNNISIRGRHLGDKPPDLSFFSPGELDFSFAPLRNLEGGSTAVVTQYCAVNANTKRVKKTLAVIDALLCRDYQKGGLLYQYFEEMPMYRDLGAGDPERNNLWRFNEEQEDTWHRICKDINIVRFPSLLDKELDSMMMDIEDTMMESLPADPERTRRDGRLADCTISDEKLAEIISEHYRQMQRLLDES